MNNITHVLDTNVILGFATNFEKHHNDCQKYFLLDHVKTTCSRVITELNVIRNRRRKLYDDLKKFIDEKFLVTSYKPSITLKKNDEKHLKSLLPILTKIPPHKLLKYIDRKEREIQSGVNEARKYLKTPYIQPYHYAVLETDLEKWIYNKSDCCILSDSVCWAEDNSRIIFCSNDYTDFIKNREDIYYSICGVRGFEYRNKPLEILSVKEILAII